MKEIHLFDLPEELYIKLNESFTTNIFSKIKENFGSLVKFASYSGIKEQVLRDSKNRGILLTIHNLKLISQHIHINEFSLEKEVQAIKFKGGFIKNPNLPFRIDKNIGVIIGGLLGDGGVSRSGYEVHYTNKINDQVDSFLSTIKETFGNVKIITDRIDDNVRTIKLSGVLGRILVKILKVPFGKKVFQDYEIPECIMNGNETVIKSFLRRLFDDEGTVIESNKLIALVTAVKKDTKKYLQEPQRLLNLKYLLSLFGIRSACKKVKDRMYFYKETPIEVEDWKLNIHDRSSLQQFATNIGFDISYKAKKLEKIISSYKLWETPKNESLNFFFDGAQKLVSGNGSFTSKMLSKETGRSIRRTNRVIRKLLQKRLLYQIDNKIRNRNFSIYENQYK